MTACELPCCFHQDLAHHMPPPCECRVRRFYICFWLVARPRIARKYTKSLNVVIKSAARAPSKQFDHGLEVSHNLARLRCRPPHHRLLGRELAMLPYWVSPCHAVLAQKMVPEAALTCIFEQSRARVGALKQKQVIANRITLQAASGVNPSFSETSEKCRP